MIGGVTATDAADQDWSELARRVRDRRTAMGLRQTDIEEAGGPSTATVRAIEQAARTNFSDRTLRELARALQWRVEVPQKILDGTATEADLTSHAVYTEAAAAAAEAGHVFANLPRIEMPDIAPLRRALEPALRELHRLQVPASAVLTPEARAALEQTAAQSALVASQVVSDAPRGDAPSRKVDRLYHLAHDLVGELMTTAPTPARAAAQEALLDLLHELSRGPAEVGDSKS